MRFNYWESHDKQNIRLYLDGTTGDAAIYIHLLKRGRLVRIKHHGDWRAAKSLEKELFLAGFDMSRQYNSINDLIAALDALPGITVNTQSSNKRPAHPPKRDISERKKKNPNTSDFGTHVSPRDFHDLSRESLSIELAKIPFKSGTKKQLRVIVDHREPDSIKDAFMRSGLNVSTAALMVGDITIEDMETGDTMIIERKTILDFRQSIISKRAHSQAESMYDMEQSLKEKGIRARCYWFIECMDNGMSYYDTLPQVKQTDGWECYTSAILGQHTVITLNPHHLVAKAIKFAQGFFDQELYYPVNVDSGTRLDKTARQRVKSESRNKTGDSDYHGVSKNNRSVAQMLSMHPSINRAVAKTLAKSGLCYRDIINLGVSSLMKFPGIGKARAEQIFDDFNRCD
jgi:ERCC4-type nuclease